MKCETPRLFLSTKAGAPSGPETTYRLWSAYAFRRPTEPARPRPPGSGGNRHAASNRAEKPETPRKERTQNDAREVDRIRGQADGSANKSLPNPCADAPRSQYSGDPN